MHIGQKVRFVRNENIGDDNIFLSDTRLANKVLTISGINKELEIAFFETDGLFSRKYWLSSVFAPAIILPNNIKVL